MRKIVFVLGLMLAMMMGGIAVPAHAASDYSRFVVKMRTPHCAHKGDRSDTVYGLVIKGGMGTLRTLVYEYSPNGVQAYAKNHILESDLKTVVRIRVHREVQTTRLMVRSVGIKAGGLVMLSTRLRYLPECA